MRMSHKFYRLRDSTHTTTGCTIALLVQAHDREHRGPRLNHTEDAILATSMSVSDRCTHHNISAYALVQLR